MTIKLIIGIFLAILSSTFANLGAQIQKLAHKKIADRTQQNSIFSRSTANSREDEEEVSNKDPYYFLHPLWILGLILAGLGSLSSLSAVAFAPQTIIAPVSSITFLINMMLTPIMQKERLPRIIVGITIGITCGSVLAIIFAPRHETEPESISEFIDVYASMNFLIYALCIIIILCSLWIAAEKYKDKDGAIHRFCYPAFCGIFGGQNLLIGKGVSKSILLSFSDKGLVFVHWGWYLLLIALISFGILYVRWYNRGLKKFSPLQFVAIGSAFWMFTVIIGGLAVFDEMNQFKDALSISMFCIGTLVSILFMFCLSAVKPMEISPAVFIEPEPEYDEAEAITMSDNGDFRIPLEQNECFAEEWTQAST